MSCSSWQSMCSWNLVCVYLPLLYYYYDDLRECTTLPMPNAQLCQLYYKWHGMRLSRDYSLILEIWADNTFLGAQFGDSQIREEDLGICGGSWWTSHLSKVQSKSKLWYSVPGRIPPFTSKTKMRYAQIVMGLKGNGKVRVRLYTCIDILARTYLSMHSWVQVSTVIDWQ
jgi:hypothetical protein